MRILEQPLLCFITPQSKTHAKEATENRNRVAHHLEKLGSSRLPIHAKLRLTHLNSLSEQKNGSTIFLTFFSGTFFYRCFSDGNLSGSPFLAEGWANQHNHRCLYVFYTFLVCFSRRLKPSSDPLPFF